MPSAVQYNKPTKVSKYAAIRWYTVGTDVRTRLARGCAMSLAGGDAGGEGGGVKG